MRPRRRGPALLRGPSASPLGERALSLPPPQAQSGTDYWDLVAPHWSELNEAWYLGPDVFLARLQTVPLRSQHLYASHWCYSEVCNGGFYQFFFNTTGILAPEAVSGFHAMGADELSEILSRALAYFGPHYPRVRELRMDSLGTFGTDSLDRVEVLMAIEEELIFEVPDDDAERSAVITFRELVVQIARKRGVV